MTLTSTNENIYLVNLEKIFYSPTKNECMFTIIISEFSSDNGKLNENKRYSIYRFGSESPYFNGNFSEYTFKMSELESNK